MVHNVFKDEAEEPRKLVWNFIRVNTSEFSIRCNDENVLIVNDKQGVWFCEHNLKNLGLCVHK